MHIVETELNLSRLAVSTYREEFCKIAQVQGGFTSLPTIGPDGFTVPKPWFDTASSILDTINLYMPFNEAFKLSTNDATFLISYKGSSLVFTGDLPCVMVLASHFDPSRLNFLIGPKGAPSEPLDIICLHPLVLDGNTWKSIIGKKHDKDLQAFYLMKELTNA